MVNFGEVWRAQLAKSTLLISSLVSLGSFKVCSDARERVQKATGSYRIYLSLVKLQPRFLSLQCKTCLWAELQPWCLSLQWRTCPWAEHWWWWWGAISILLHNNIVCLGATSPSCSKNKYCVIIVDKFPSLPFAFACVYHQLVISKPRKNNQENWPNQGSIPVPLGESQRCYPLTTAVVETPH